jgi:predicted nucleic acid-binding protein
MSARSFIDTNVLLYADSVDEPEKQSVALALIGEHLREGTGVVSTQVLQEYAVGALKKLGLPDALVLSRLDLYARFDVVVASVASLKAGLAVRALHQLPFWDALIVQAARDGGCAVLLSEDMASGATLAGVRIVNPFDVAGPVARPRRKR